MNLFVEINWRYNSVFVQMFYWSIGTFNKEGQSPVIDNSHFFVSNIINRKTNFRIAGDADNVRLICSVNNINDLVSCNYTLYYNPSEIRQGDRAIACDDWY